MPKGTMNNYVMRSSLPGYQGCDTIKIEYYFPSGWQGANDPSPGSSYSGTSRTAYLPDNREGREVLRLLKLAFERKLTFIIGTSVTTGCNNTVVWNDIHHKTSKYGGPSG
uniref:E3 ubiquitin-protein ligase n=1 Tax=Saccoglossus kowalevskii TaxID=10224 RepID=A0ABM0H204_SACKO